MQQPPVEQGLSPLSKDEMKRVEGGAIPLPDVHIEWDNGGIWIETNTGSAAEVQTMGDLGGGQPEVIKEESERG